MQSVDKILNFKLLSTEDIVPMKTAYSVFCGLSRKKTGPLLLEGYALKVAFKNLKEKFLNATFKAVSISKESSFTSISHNAC